MKLLFITTYNISIEKEHFFTQNVINGLIDSQLPLVILTIKIDNSLNTKKINIQEYKGISYYILKTPFSNIVKAIKEIFIEIDPSVIHSNMTEAHEVKAAIELHIPIIHTIHIGGFICPRGGGNGFLYYNDEICSTSIGHRQCLRCCCQDLPGKDFNYYLLSSFSLKRRMAFYRWIRYKPFMYYLTPLLSITNNIENSIKKIDIFKYSSAIIAANNKLKNVLEVNGINQNNIHVIPHGINPRKKIPLPVIQEGIVKFYFLGRIQYSKGLHILFKALEQIKDKKCEVHIIGGMGNRRRGTRWRYYKNLLRMTKKLPVTFYNFVPNEEIESLIQNFHVMIHPTICMEVFGIAISESLSLGRPVLATRCGGPEMQVFPEKNGWLVEPNDVEALKEKLIYIMDNPQEIIQYSHNCKVPELKDYINKLKDLYRKKELHIWSK